MNHRERAEVIFKVLDSYTVDELTQDLAAVERETLERALGIAESIYDMSIPWVKNSAGDEIRQRLKEAIQDSQVTAGADQTVGPVNVATAQACAGDGPPSSVASKAEQWLCPCGHPQTDHENETGACGLAKCLCDRFGTDWKPVSPTQTAQQRTWGEWAALGLQRLRAGSTLTQEELAAWEASREAPTACKHETLGGADRSGDLFCMSCGAKARPATCARGHRCDTCAQMEDPSNG